jgi:hypothetical protein
MTPDEFRAKYYPLFTEFMHWHLMQDVESLIEYLSPSSTLLRTPPSQGGESGWSPLGETKQHSPS